MDPTTLMTPIPGPTSPAGSPSDNLGAQADAVSKIRESINMLELALPGLDTGSEIHKAVLDTIKKLSTYAPSSAAVPGVQSTQLLGLQKAAKDNGMLRMLASAMGSGQAAPPVQPM